MKKKLFLKFFVLAVIGAFVTFTSCKDYDDDISKLEKDIAALSSTLNELKAKVDGGAVITNVTSTNDGVTVTLSDGKTFTLTNGKDGIDGDNGKDGSVVTIGENGNWFIDGKDTELAAQGPKGDKGDAGEAGKDGNDGKDGKDGVYYVPNADGYWYKHDGDDVTKTDDKWLLPGVITAVMNEFGDVEFHNVKSGDETFAVTFYNNKLLRSLVLIPYYYVNGVEAIGFYPLEYVTCEEPKEGEKGPVKKLANPKDAFVQYYVNPSTVTEDMIDTENLSFVYKLQENKLRSADINAKAKFESLKDGVLTVSVDLDALEAEKGSWTSGFQSIDKMDMLALQVPLSDKAKKEVENFEPVITSDWARVDVELVKDLQIDRSGQLCDVDEETYSNDYNTLELAKAQDDPYLIELKYDEKHNLLDYITATGVFGACGEIDPTNYGLVWNFDLKDENDKTIVYKLTTNATDQQEFIKLLDNQGNIESRVYTETGTAPTGRTPIVRVQIIDPATKCVISEGFVKIKWVKDRPVFDADYPAKKVDFDCEDIGFTVETPWMNTNVFNAMNTDYTDFYFANKLDTKGLYDADGKLLAGTDPKKADYAWGKVVDKADVGAGKPEVTDLFSVNLKNICDATSGKTFTGYVHYVSKIDGNVTVRVKVTMSVNVPTLSVAGHNNTYWQGGNNSSNVFMVNPVQFKTDPQVNPTANYRTDLLNGFTDGKSYNDTINTIVKSSIKGHKPCDVKFVFDEDALESYVYTTADGEEYSLEEENLRVSGGTKLEFSPEEDEWILAADIYSYNEMPGFDSPKRRGEAIRLNTDANEFAQSLVGKKVPVKLTAELCCSTKCKDFSRDIRKFEVYFIPPMHINSSFTESFTDLITGGDYIKLDKAFTLTDFAGYLVSTATDNPSATNEKHRWTNSLWDYYEINNVVWNTAAAKCNLGNNAEGDLDVIEGVKNALPINYIISYENTAPNLNSLKYQNNSGASIRKDFEIYVPVTVDHKWGTLSATVTIKVKENTIVQP